MDLTVSIVNWNVRDYLERCLASIEAHSGSLQLEVFVVDNASSDGSAAMARERFPKVALIENSENVGFGRAHNQVLPLAAGRHILFLNPDTELLPETLPAMLGFMEAHPEAGAMMPRELEGPGQAEEAIDLDVLFKGPERILRGLAERVHAAFPSRFTERYLIDSLLGKIHVRSGEVCLGVSGMESGCLWVRHQALREAGGFSPRFFLGGEGLELTERIRQRGWKLFYVPSIAVVHYGSKSSERWDPAELDARIAGETRPR